MKRVLDFRYFNFRIIIVVIVVFYSTFGSKASSDAVLSVDDFYLDDFNPADELLKSEFKFRYGLGAGYNFNFLSTDFSELHNYPIYSNVFRTGYGSGLSWGVLVQKKVTDLWNIGIRLDVSNLNGVLTSTLQQPVTINGEITIADIDNVIDCAINTIVFSPFIGRTIPRLSNDFYVFAGLDIGALLKSNFSQYEKLVSPHIGTFENGYRIRNNTKADLPNKSDIIGGLNIGFRYELALNKNKNIRLVPEIKYHYWVTSPVSGLSWNTHQLSAGISLTYNAPPRDAPKYKPLPPPLPNLPLPVFNNISEIEISHIIKNEVSEKDSTSIIVEDFAQTNLKPILNYIFFEENSSTIPKRYKQISNTELISNEYRYFAGMSSLETYYYVLDIIGFRLKNNPAAKIELVGNNSNKGEERNNLALSSARANSVKEFLVNKWDINPNRITTTAHLLPKDPSNINDPKGDEENRRVEIYSNDPRITEAIISFDTVSVIHSSAVSFRYKVNNTWGVDSCYLLIIDKNQNVIIDTALNVNLSSIDFPLKDLFEIVGMETNSFNYQLIVKDKLGQTNRSPVKSVNVDRITIASKRDDRFSVDIDYENFSLILFEFGSISLGTKHNQVIDYIKKRIGPDSKINISGYTDIIGSVEVNKRIATERAVATARRLGLNDVEIIGVGNDELLFDNIFPEGRFYCRTVVITAETPIRK